jgi:hypothetical protein
MLIRLAGRRRKALENLLDSRDVVDSIGRKTPVANIFGQVFTKARFVGVLLRAEFTLLHAPRHSVSRPDEAADKRRPAADRLTRRPGMARAAHRPPKPVC